MAVTGRLGAALAAALLVVLGLAMPAFAQTTTSTALGSSPNPSNVGESVTFTATVTPTPDGGTVAFSGGGISGCDTQALSSGVATCTTSALAAGSNQTITAVYSGDTNFDTSTGTVSQTVTPPHHHRHRPRVLAEPLQCRRKRHLHRHGDAHTRWRHGGLLRWRDLRLRYPGT